jgi:hypothetical protein
MKTHQQAIMMLTCGGKVILVKCTFGMMMEVVQHGYQYLKVQQVFKVLRVLKDHKGIKDIKV